MLKEEEEKQKQLEYIKIKEWEEKFDKEQKINEANERRREQRLLQKELDKQRIFDEKDQDTVDKGFSSQLEKLDIDKSKKN